MFRRLILTTTLLTISSSMSCLDLPPFYRATLFQGEAKQNVSDWTSHIDFCYAEGSTRKAWNTQEVKTHLFNAYGPFDLRMLALNVENIAEKPLTKQYLEEETGSLVNKPTGKVEFGGHFSTEEFDITFQQNILYGLYVQAHLPIRRLKLNNIHFVSTEATRAEELDTFINEHLDDILKENGICPYKTPFNATELSDPLISLGWHGHCKMSNSPVTALRGFIQGGIVIPTGSHRPTNRVFSLPFGHNKHIAFHARANGHATLWKKLVLGANAGVTVFLKQAYDQRLTTSDKQNGYILLEKGRASVDPGTQWDITTYIKGEHLFGGFSVLAGISYTQQERSNLVLKDDNVLKTACSLGKVVNKDEVINYNKHLKEWYHYVFHTYAEYDFKTHTEALFAPKLQIGYHAPILGKHAWPADMWNGTLSLALNWCA